MLSLHWVRGVARGCAKGALAHPLEKNWLEGSTGLKNDPQGRQVFPLASTPLGTFLATPLYWVILLERIWLSRLALPKKFMLFQISTRQRTEAISRESVYRRFIRPMRQSGLRLGIPWVRTLLEGIGRRLTIKYIPSWVTKESLEINLGENKTYLCDALIQQGNYLRFSSYYLCSIIIKFFPLMSCRLPNTYELSIFFFIIKRKI